MSKMNYKRTQSASFAPRFSRQTESERQEGIMSRMGKGDYYAMKGRAARAEASRERLITKDQLILANEHRKRIKLKKDRLEMMLEMKRLKEL